MTFAAFLLAASLAGTTVPPAEIASVVFDVRDVVLAEGALPLAVDPDEARARTARLLIVWAWKESRWVTAALDSKGACGVLQVSAWHLPALGTSCAAVRASRSAGFRAGLRLMRERIETCGSVRGGLGSYAAGPCGGVPQLVSWRLHLAEAA